MKGNFRGRRFLEEPDYDGKPGWKVPETSRSKNVVVGPLKINKGGGELLLATRKSILILGDHRSKNTIVSNSKEVFYSLLNDHI